MPLLSAPRVLPRLISRSRKTSSTESHLEVVKRTHKYTFRCVHVAPLKSLIAPARPQLPKEFTHIKAGLIGKMAVDFEVALVGSGRSIFI